MLDRMYKAAEDRGTPMPADPKHPDACPVLGYEDPFVAGMMSLYAAYSEHGLLLRAPAVIEEQPARYWEAMRIIGSVAGDRQRLATENNRNGH